MKNANLLLSKRSTMPFVWSIVHHVNHGRFITVQHTNHGVFCLSFTACTDTFESFANKNANGATGHVKNAVEECKALCLSMATCTAFDWAPDDATSKCWIHTDAQQALDMKDAQGVTHYVRKDCDEGRLLHYQKVESISQTTHLRH